MVKRATIDFRKTLAPIRQAVTKYGGRGVSRGVALCLTMLLAATGAGQAALGETETRAEAGQAVARLVRALKAADLAAYQQALDDACRHDGGAAAIPALAEALAEESLCGWAAYGLSEIGPKAVPALTKDLLDQPRSLRAARVEALARIGPEAKAAWPVLIESLRVDASEPRLCPRPYKVPPWQAREPRPSVAGPALAAMGPEIVSLLAEALGQSPGSFERLQIVQALGQIGSPEALPALTKALDDPHSIVRAEAARAICRLRPRAKGSAEALSCILKEMSLYYPLQEDLAAYYRQLGAEGISILVRILRKPDVLLTPVRDRSQRRDRWPETCVRVNVAQVLQWMGPDAAPAAEALAEALGDREAEVRREAAVALGSIGLKARPAAPALLKRLKDKDLSVRIEAAKALVEISSEQEAAARVLVRALFEHWGVDMSTADSVITETLAKVGPVAVARLRAALRKPARRQRGIEILGKMGPAAEDAVPGLVALLDHAQGGRQADADQRDEIVHALGEIHANAEVAVPALVRALGDEEGFVRFSAVWALRQFGPEAAPAVDPLVELLGDEELGSMASEALESVGPAAIPGLMAALSVRDETAGEMVAYTLAKLGPEAIGGLAERLSDEDPVVRRWSACGLGELGRAARKCTPQLQALLEDDTPEVRVEAAGALLSVDLSEATVARVAQLLSDPDPYVRKEVVELFAWRGGWHKVAAVPRLVDALEDPDDEVADGARHALFMIAFSQGGRHLQGSLPELTSLLGSPAPSVRASAAMLVGRIGPPAGPAVPKLIALLEDTDPSVRARAAGALGGIGGDLEAAVPRLIAMLDEGEASVRAAAAEGLSGAGPAAKPAVKRLVKLLDDEEDPVRAAAAPALGRIAPGDEQAVSALVARLEHPKPAVRQAAAQGLGAMGPAAREAIPALVTAAEVEEEDPNRPAQTAVINALAETGKEAVPALRRLVWHVDYEIGRRAAAAIGGIRPAPREAVPDLVEALDAGQVNSVYVCDGARASLVAMGPAAVPELVLALHGPHRTDVLRMLGEAPSGVLAAQEDLARLVSLGESDAAALLEPLGPEAVDAVPVLLAALESPDPMVRVRAAGTLARIDPQTRRGVPVLLALLGSSDGCLDFWVADALRKYGPRAPEAVPALKRLLPHGGDPSLTEYMVACAILEIDPSDREARAIARIGSRLLSGSHGYLSMSFGYLQRDMEAALMQAFYEEAQKRGHH